MVESRWAMTKEVRLERSAFIACCTMTSVRVSTDDVASSKISNAGWDRNARAIVISWRSPAETDPPSWSTSVS